MGLLDLFRLSKAQSFELPVLDIDLGLFSCGHTKIGARPDPRDPFADVSQKRETINDPFSGLEIGVKSGVLDYVFITLAQSDSHFFRSGSPLQLSTRTTISDVQSIFGEPYWMDEDSDEVILFYEYENGALELQFEFPGKAHLGSITLAVHGVLSKAEQRNAYKVTKPWPPKNTDSVV